MQTPPSLLLVDDEEGIRSVLSLLLADMGYAVTVAAGGAEALETMERLQPRIVVSDIKMPGMDGIELLTRIKQQYPETEVLMLTGHGDIDLAVKSLRRGAGDFLSKPISPEALEVALERAMQRLHIRETLRHHTEHLEELVEQRTRELIQTERFAAVGEAAAHLAHTIKNIAGALEGTMFVLERGLSLNKREYFEQGWEMIRADVGRLRDLSMRLLDLGRPAHPVFAPIDPNEPAREVIALATARAQRAGVTLELHEGATTLFSTDNNAVHLCLLNLVLNGIEACEQKNGEHAHRVTLTVKQEQRARLRLLSYTVADTGTGVPQEFTSLPSPSFASTKETGSGIGLFSIRKTAHEIGAELTFSQAEPTGTRVTLTLREQGDAFSP